MTYLDRMYAEHADLAAKIQKLESFRITKEYHALAQEEQDRLTAQLMFMRGYEAVLRMRVAYGNRTKSAP